MPTINRLQKKRREPTQSESAKQRRKMYATSEWQNLRNWFISVNPCCWLCQYQDGKVVVAEDIHHLDSILENETNLLNINNLISLCKRHHGWIHAQKREIWLKNIYSAAGTIT